MTWQYSVVCFGCALTLALAAGCRSAPRTPLPPLQPAPDITAENDRDESAELPLAPLTHTVQRGQTMYSIARAYGVSVEELAKHNGISDSRRISTGQVLEIPDRLERPREPPTLRNLPSGAAAGWAWPMQGTVTSGYGAPRGRGRTHKGIDIDGRRGTPVLAARSGVVTAVGKLGAFGLRIEIKHDNGWKTIYAHLSRSEVREGQKVDVGQPVALSGATGNARGAHLHFEVHQHDRAINPQLFLPVRR